MYRVWAAVAVVVSASAAMAQPPAYTAASVVNASDYSAGPFAPGSLITIFGTNLAFGAAGLTAENTSGATLPFTLGNVRVVIDNTSAPLLYVSPTQINVMIPPDEIAGAVPLQVVRQTVPGPVVSISLVSAAPALFVSTERFALAQDYNTNYAISTANAPAQPGDLMILYATGLGGTQPLPLSGEIPQTAALINGFASGILKVMLNGNAIDPKLIAYAGLTPKYAGLYQINFYVPTESPPNPLIRVAMGQQMSAGNVMLPVAAKQ